MFVLVSMNILRLSWQAEFEMNYKFRELLKSVENLIKIRTKCTSNSNRLSLFTYFPKVLECCKCARKISLRQWSGGAAQLRT